MFVCGKPLPLQAKIPVTKYIQSINYDLFITRSTINAKETIEIDGVTYPLVKVEISNTSHPFYTGKSKLVDTAGRVDKFMSRYGNRNKK